MPKTTLPSTLTFEATLGTSNVTRLHVDMARPKATNAPLTIEPQDCIDVLYAVVSGGFPAHRPSAEIIPFSDINQKLTA